jgi:hypothetical protein
MMSTDYEADPSQVDPLKYLAEVNGHQSPEEYLEHYHVLRPPSCA